MNDHKPSIRITLFTVFLTAMITLSISVLPKTHAANGPKEKQLVCHVDEYGEIIPLMLPQNAVKAHERHGDMGPMTFYLDADGDGYRAENAESIVGCLPHELYVSIDPVLEFDCNDFEEAINPGATEIVGNGIDDDCDPTTSDDAPPTECTSGDRYEDLGDGTVQDCNTRLIWLKDASCEDLANTTSGGQANWDTANLAAAALSNGTCGLTDGSAAGDWRLPTIGEFCNTATPQSGVCPLANRDESLVNSNFFGPTVTNTTGTAQWTEGNAFVGVQSSHYWSSTESDDFNNAAWVANLHGGHVVVHFTTSVDLVWPVRVGQ